MEDQVAQQAYLARVEAASLLIPELLMEDLEKTYLGRISFTPGDPYITAFLEGERSMVVHLRQLQAGARERLRRQAELPGQEGQ